MRDAGSVSVMAHKFALVYLLLVSASPGGVIGNNQDPDLDYFLDESYLNLNQVDRSEVERLLREYPSNQELVRSIGAQYYQFVNVAQIRHHQIMGLSTREGTSKAPRAQAQVMQAPQQPRAGKHFHRTSFLIQAFNHKFRLILELNPTLIAPNVIQKHILNEQTLQRERTELEMCYYHGIVEGLEWSAAAVRTCNGLSGIIHMGNETFVIHPFQGGDLSHKHPHIVFEAKSLGRQTCGNKRGLEYNMPSGMSSFGDLGRKIEDNAPKYFVELALLLDKAMFDKRNGSTRLSVVHDALQIVNIADLYFRKMSTAISVVYVETWLSNNHLQVDIPDDLRKTLVRLTDIYGPRNLFSVNKDSTMLLSGISFTESGMGVPMSICTSKAMGVVTDVSIYQPHITGVALAHMIGHNLNMNHDHDMEKCHCPTWYGCIMNEHIVGNDGIHPYIFSDCSRRSYFGAINSGHAMCLINRPNAIDPIYKTCGNGIVEAGEECDCGSEEDCERDPCCERLYCRLKTTSECSSNSPCCENCKFRKSGLQCRAAASECDIPEFCTGQSGECPMNTFKKNGAVCGNSEGYCFNGYCPSLTQQCERIWDWRGNEFSSKGTAANRECYESLNVGGHHNGHCGRDLHGNYRKCEKRNVMCGTLHCKDGSTNPTLSSRLQNNTYTKIILKLQGMDHECKSLSGPMEDRTLDQIELVRDGTKCGDNKICMNQTCVLMTSFVDSSKCPTNHVSLECSGHGDCSNINICHCQPGWDGPDCSIQAPEPPATDAPKPTVFEPKPTVNGSNSQPGKETRKQTDDTGSSTIALVFGMVSTVGGVFILFAMMALCYRRSTVPKFESNYPAFNPQSFKLPATGGNGPQTTGVSGSGPPALSHEEIDNRILSFTQLPAYRDQHSSLGMHGSTKNLGGGGGGGEEEMGDETSAFLGTPNSGGGVGRFPERGILKKYIEEDGSQSDNNEGLCDVERTLKSLNGYHEDILAALRVAAAQRGIGDVNSTPPPQSGPRLSDGYSDYPDFSSEFPLLRNSSDLMPHSLPQGDDDSNDGSGGPIRIRNLEDLLRQLEHHTGGHSGIRTLSPNGSEDIRISETEADHRHYHRGLHSADLGGDIEDEGGGGFVMGRYRGPGLVPRTMRSPLSDYGHFTAQAAATPDDDIDSTHMNMNLLNTSTSEEDDEPTQVARSLTPRNLMKNIYNPSEDSYGSESPRRHHNGSKIFGHHDLSDHNGHNDQPQHFPEYSH